MSCHPSEKRWNFTEALKTAAPRDDAEIETGRALWIGAELRVNQVQQPEGFEVIVDTQEIGSLLTHVRPSPSARSSERPQFSGRQYGPVADITDDRHRWIDGWINATHGA
jgi:hypothetical protein